MSRRLCLLLSILTAVACHSGALAIGAELSEKVQFNRDIRPILSENCFACHGFDAKKRKAKLRLDTPEGAFAAMDDHVPIKAGDPSQSEVWRRILLPDSDDDVMPPPDSHKKLNAAQKETLRRWIEQGAPYQKHWAFEAPVKAPAPTAPGATNPIDAFVLQRLRTEGLVFSQQADRPTLIRRVAFALTGLPPTLTEIDAYTKDVSERAYERMVDQYLDSPRFGEEMARHWLDVARYADTHGLHLDNERSMWAYRDWVVKAFNQNLPFDQFTVWQIAGDLLPHASQDQVTATGFNRCNVTTSEGGAIPAEFLYRYAVDRTATLTTTWMGLTGGCAVCHDHKYDPLTTREFYSLYSFFYSAADPGMDKNIALTEPVERLPKAGQQAALDAATTKESEARKALETAAAQAAYADPADVNPAPAPVAVTQALIEDAFPLGAGERNTSRNPATWVTDPPFKSPTGHRVLKLASSHFYDEAITPGTEPFLMPTDGKFELWVRPDAESPPQVFAMVINAGGNRRLLWGSEDQAQANLPMVNPTKVEGAMPKPGEWTKLTFTADDLGVKPGVPISSYSLQVSGGVMWCGAFHLAGNLAPAADPLASFATWWQEAAGSPNPKRKGKGATTGIDSAEVPANLHAVLKRGPDKPSTADERRRLVEFYLGFVARPVNADLAAKRAAWLAARSAHASAEDAIAETMVFHDMDKPRDAFVMTRGQYDKTAEPVFPATPAFLPALKKADPEGRATRLDLARWLVSPEHPLTARVTVNRFWQQMFGLGLVKTSHDLGSQGEPPSHPELLDWLAVEFRESGWNVKALMRLMVMSRAFRQQSVVSPELEQRDPENRLYARGPRFRLDAEQIRDNALFVGGLLNFQVGGPGVRTYQPPNIWEPVGYADSNTRFYLQDHGSALYRRSIYCFLKRTAPPPFMSNFDAPNREQSCTRRERSDTPIQALQLMNDVQHFEAARALAERTLQEGGATDASRLTWLCRTVLSRAPDAQEQELLTNALTQQRELYLKDPTGAAQAIGAGESKAKHVASAPETAAWTMLANLTLNLDETLNRN